MFVMKISWLLLMLIILPSVNALGNTFKLDFDSKDRYPLLMDKGDRVVFEYGGYNHTIILDDLKKNVAELDIFLFLESDPHTPNYVYLNDKYDIRLDFDKKDGKEMSIEYNSVDLQNQRAMITFRKLEAWDEDAKLTPFWELETKNNRLKVYYILGGVMVLALFVFILITIRSKKRGIYF